MSKDLKSCRGSKRPIGADYAHGPHSASSSRMEPIQRLMLKHKLTALVIDDESVNRSIHFMLLRNLGVEAYELDNGKSAIDACLRGARFDLIIMDMEMPVMDGIRATKLLRAMGICSKIVGVADNSRRQEMFMNAGIDAFYVKPITCVEMIPILEEIDNSKI